LTKQIRITTHPTQNITPHTTTTTAIMMDLVDKELSADELDIVFEILICRYVFDSRDECEYFLDFYFTSI
jgi:uncharacterized CHY-type Zn-finger protein